MQKFGETWSEDLVRYTHLCAPVLEQYFQGLVKTYPILTKVIDDIKPDFIVFDHLFSTPVGVDKGIKWANLFSAAL